MVKNERISIDIRKFHPGLSLVVLGAVAMTTENRQHGPVIEKSRTTRIRGDCTQV